MLIRQFAMDDYDAAARIWDAGDHMSAPPREECERKLERDPQLFLVAEDDGAIAGAIMGTYDGRRGWIFRLAVDPNRRKHGVGRALVEELERRFAEMQVASIRLLVVGQNAGGREFWTRMGYTEFEDIIMGAKELPLPGALDGGAC